MCATLGVVDSAVCRAMFDDRLAVTAADVAAATAAAALPALLALDAACLTLVVLTAWS